MSDSSLFKWRHFEADLILCAVRWYLRYALSYRDLEEIMLERGLNVDHTAIFRWVQRYAPKLDQRCRPHLKATNDSYQVDETYIKIKKQWHYLYRAVDSTGHTLDFMLSTTRDAKAAERFFREALRALHTAPPRVITVDNDAAYPPAFEALQQAGQLPKGCRLRQHKYLNNIVEQDHRFVKRRVNPGLGFGSFDTAQRTLQGYEAMHMLRKGQLEGADKGGCPRPEPRHQPAVRIGRITNAHQPLLTLQIVFAAQPFNVRLRRLHNRRDAISLGGHSERCLCAFCEECFVVHFPRR